MGWFKRDKQADSKGDSVNIMEGMWIKCTVCRAIIFKREVDRNLKVCPKCHYHFPMSIEDRVALLADPGTFQEWDADLVPGDPLQFEDTLPYPIRVQNAQRKTGKQEAILTGRVDESADILGKAGPAVTAAGIDERVTDATVGADAETYILHIDAKAVTEIGDFVHEGNLGRQHGVAGILGHLGVLDPHEKDAVMVAAEVLVEFVHDLAGPI